MKLPPWHPRQRRSLEIVLLGEIAVLTSARRRGVSIKPFYPWKRAAVPVTREIPSAAGFYTSPKKPISTARMACTKNAFLEK
jgi:hypothetical protein